MNQRYTLSSMKRPALALALALALIVPAVGSAAVLGRAYGAWVYVPSMGYPSTYICDTGWLPSTGGSLTSHAYNVAMGTVLQLASSDSHTQSDTCGGHSDNDLVSGVVLDGHPAKITFDGMHSEDDDTCCAIPKHRRRSHFTSLTIGGNPVTPSGAFNEVFTIPGVATVVVNEMSKDGNKDCQGQDEYVFRALHVTLASGEHIILGSTRFDDSHDCCTNPTKTTDSTWGRLRRTFR
ncbi:MAG: hypothetical protein HZB25_06400 [Candidatus Eisenbacteria bacterium]|nr:hypothetical protein [Candidatus Eisenbacteria bacterium]